MPNNFRAKQIYLNFTSFAVTLALAVGATVLMMLLSLVGILIVGVLFSEVELKEGNTNFYDRGQEIIVQSPQIDYRDWKELLEHVDA
jgi:hypothetical protein